MWGAARRPAHPVGGGGPSQIHPPNDCPEGGLSESGGEILRPSVNEHLPGPRFGGSVFRGAFQPPDRRQCPAGAMGGSCP